MGYRFEAASPEGVVQLIAANYLRHGYYFYVTGKIKEKKDPVAVANRLIEKYDIGISDWARAKRKRSGLANAQLILFRNWFCILLTEGHHKIRQPKAKGGEGKDVKDCRRHPIRFEGYSISYRQAGYTPQGEQTRKWHACVRIDRKTYGQLKDFFLDRACRRSVDNLAMDFARVPFARFAPIRRQLLNVLRATNKARASAGFDAVPASALRLRRKPIKVYLD